MVDVDFKTCCEDFEVEFTVGSLREDAGISEANIDEREALLDKYIHECNEELARLTSHADSTDLLASVCCGVVAGIIDAVFVGKWDFAKAKAISKEEINHSVISFAKKNPKYKEYLGKGRDGDRLDTALKFLEREYHLPGDGAYATQGLNLGIGGKDHRLADFCHHNSVIGLISCILVQFSEKTVFLNPAGDLFRVPIVVNEYGQLIGSDPLSKIFSGVVNWFFTAAKTVSNHKGHLMSDKATSQGIPGTFMSILKELSSLPFLKNKEFGANLRKAYASGIGTAKSQLDLGQFNALFSGTSSKFDIRTEMAIGQELKRQSIPVLINEMLVRGTYFIRRFIDEMKEKGDISKISWQNCIPYNNRTIQRMVTVASGTFLAIDLADALIESAITSKCNQALFAEGVILRINFVNIGRFALGCAVDLSSGFKRPGYEFLSLELTTGKMAINAERIFLRAEKRRGISIEREKELAIVMGEEITIDRSLFSIDDARLAARDLAEKKIHSYEDLKNKPWYKKMYSAITFHSIEKKLVLEDIKDIEQILTLFMQVNDSDIAVLNARVERLENAKMSQQEKIAARVSNKAPKQMPAKKIKQIVNIFRSNNKASLLTPDINAKHGGKYKIVSARDPANALSVFIDRTSMGGMNSLNGSLELVSKNNLHATVWTVESCGVNIYRIVDSESGLVIEYTPGSTSKSLLFVRKWKETASCIWEIQDRRDGTVCLLSNANIEICIRSNHKKKVVIGKSTLIGSRWILERVSF